MGRASVDDNIRKFKITLAEGPLVMIFAHGEKGVWMLDPPSDVLHAIEAILFIDFLDVSTEHNVTCLFVILFISALHICRDDSEMLRMWHLYLMRSFALVSLLTADGINIKVVVVVFCCVQWPLITSSCSTL